MATNIIQLRPRAANPGFKPHVPPFDSQNPHHVAIWNRIFELGRSNRQQREAV